MDFIQQHVDRFSRASTRLFDDLAVEFSTELERRTVKKYRELADDLQVLRGRASRVTALEQENQNLREELESCKQPSTIPQREEVQASDEIWDDLAQQNAPSTEQPRPDDLRQDKEHEALKTRYNKLYKDHQVLFAENEALAKQFLKAQQKLREWRQYGERRSSSPASAKAGHIKRNVRTGNRPSPIRLDIDISSSHDTEKLPSSPERARTPASVVPALSSVGYSDSTPSRRVTGLADSHGSIRHQRSPSIDLGGEPRPQNEGRSSSPELPPLPTGLKTSPLPDPAEIVLQQTGDPKANIGPTIAPRGSVPSSSQTTGVSDREKSPTSIGYSSDTPTVVAVKTLKRKRPTSRQGTAKTPRTVPVGQVEPVSVKDEPRSSSPAVEVAGPLVPPSFDNLDLDDGVLEHGVGRKAFLSNRRLSGLDRPQFYVPPRVIELSESPMRATSEPIGIQSSPHRSDPLTPISANIRRLPGEYERTTYQATKKQRGGEARGVAAIPIIAEDGDELLDRPQARKVTQLKSPLAVAAHRRLGGLLAEPSPNRSALQQPSRSAPTRPGPQPEPQGLDHDISMAPMPPKRPLQTPNTSSRRPRTLTNQILNDEGLTPDHEPFRALPLHKLGLEHFKINPNNNQGLDYAYTDVVRRRDERKCLPGCTRPECCGNKFRALAAAGLSAKRPSLNLLSSSPVEEDDADRRLLENFLGTDRERLETMTSEDRAELLLDAKTKQLAEAYGRHRHAHDRPKSPPGFWRTDMPGTQEMEQDRIEAQKRVRQAVEERRREAARGGMWKFADE